MDWKWISLGFVVLAVICLVLREPWSIYATAFCFFVAVLTFLVSIFGKRGSTVWKGRGQG
jgi:hypothetical protein